MDKALLETRRRLKRNASPVTPMDAKMLETLRVVSAFINTVYVEAALRGIGMGGRLEGVQRLVSDTINTASESPLEHPKPASE